MRMKTKVITKIKLTKERLCQTMKEKMVTTKVGLMRIQYHQYFSHLLRTTLLSLRKRIITWIHFSAWVLSL